MEATDIDFESTESFRFKERTESQFVVSATANRPQIRRGNLLVVSNKYGYVVAGGEKCTCAHPPLLFSPTLSAFSSMHFDNLTMLY